MISRREGTGWEVDETLDASLHGLWYFGMFDADDPRIVATMQAVRDRLWVKTEVGGLARYEDDYYHQVSRDIINVPGNPWFICTLWLAQWYIATAREASDLIPAMDILEWAAAHALPSGVMAEQVNPYTNAPISVSPLTWSHATLVATVQEYLAKASALRPH
jgi:GH15 family glucan-1,4-alpha-glucosidase